VIHALDPQLAEVLPRLEPPSDGEPGVVSDPGVTSFHDHATGESCWRRTWASPVRPDAAEAEDTTSRPV
jgi:hypothetical protein